MRLAHMGGPAAFLFPPDAPNVWRGRLRLVFLVNESVDKATGLQLKLCLLTVFVTAETVLLPDF